MAIAQHTISLLLVDGHPDGIARIRRHLGDDPQRVSITRTAELGREAIELCEALPPDCLLLGLRLPDMSGAELLQALAGADGRLPFAVVLLVDPADEQAAHGMLGSGDRAGAVVQEYVLRERLTPEVLRIAVRSALAQHRLHAEIRAQRVRLDALEAARADLERHASRVGEREAAIRAIADSAPMVMYTFDVAARRNTFLNDRARVLLGFDADEPIADGAFDRMHPDDRQQVFRHFGRVAASDDGSVLSFEYRMRHKDGGWRWFRSHDRAFARSADGDLRQIVGLAEDITARKEAEEALRASEERFRLAAEAVQGLVFDWDLATGTIYRSEGLAGVLGFTPEEAEPTAAWWLERIHPDDLPTLQALSDEHIRRRAPGYSGEYRVRHRDERWIWVRENGRVDWGTGDRPLRIVGSTWSIDAERRAVEADRRLRLDAEVAARQAEEAHALLDTIFASAPVGLAYFDRDLRFARLNPALAEMNGLPVEAHLGRSPLELLPDLGGLDEIVARWREVMQTGRPLLDVEVVGETPAEPGRHRVWREAFYPVRVGAETIGLGVIVEDVTERQAAEEALRASEQRLQLVVEAAHDGIWDWDLRSGEAVWSDRTFDLLGMAPGDVRPGIDLVTELIHPDDRAGFEGAVRAHLTDGLPYRIELRMRRGDGTYGWFLGAGKALRDAEGRPIRMAGSLTDISGRKAAEEALRASEQRLRLATSAARIGHFEIDWLARRRHWSPELRALLGVPDDLDIAEDLGMLDRVLPTEHLERYRAVVAASREPSSTGEFEDEHEVMRPDGTRAWVLVRGKTFFEQGPDGPRAARTLGLMMDVTTRHAAEAELGRLLDALQDANRVKDELLATVAHDLKNPLTGIRGLAQLIERTAARGQPVEHALSMVSLIVRRTTTMERLIDQLVEVARAELGQPMPLTRAAVDLGALVERLTDQLALTPSRHELQVVRPPAGGPVGQWDADRLEQVVDNLLGNAVKYSPDGSIIRVTVGSEGAGDRPGAILRVSDDGLGIPAADLPRLFERFHRGSNVRDTIRGLGIGLAGTRQIVELHGGTIGVESVEGRGTTFTIWLPLDPSAPPAP